MYWFLIVAALVGLDQYLKWLVIANVLPKGSIEVIHNFFSLTYVENFGIAFGMFKNKTWFFIIMNGIISAVVLYFILKLKDKSRSVTVCLSLILGGAIGNLIDRARLGYVVDYLHFSFFPPVFNLADSAIVVGAFLLGAIIIFKKDLNF